VLVFYDSGEVQQVDPATGNGSLYATICGPLRLPLATELIPGSSQILVLTGAQDSVASNGT
jgi:hypothetical protein